MKKTRIIPIALIAAILLRWALSPFFGDFWLLDLTNHFRPLETLVLLLLLVMLAFRRSGKLGGLAAVLALSFTFGIRAYDEAQRYRPRALPPGAKLKRVEGGIQVLTFNVWTWNERTREGVGWIDSQLSRSKPNLVLVVEASHAWVEALQTLKARLPYSIELPNDRFFGLMLLSDLPLDEVKSIRLDSFPTPALMGAVRLRTGERIRIAAIHPFAPVNPSGAGLRNELYRNLRAALDRETAPTLVFGDFNCTPWSPNFGRLLNGIGPDLSLIDAGQGLFRPHTFHALGGLLSVPIDYVLYTPQFQLKRVEVGPANGSDHRPVIAEF